MKLGIEIVNGRKMIDIADLVAYIHQYADNINNLITFEDSDKVENIGYYGANKTLDALATRLSRLL